MKAVKAKLPADQVEGFERGAQAFAKKLIGNFKDYEFVRSPGYLSIQPSHKTFSVHWRVDEPRWNGCSPQLPCMSFSWF